MVAWDGGTNGMGTDWNLAANWVGDVKPGVDDDAVINVANTTVTHASGVNTIKSLTSSNAIILSGGTLTVTGIVRQQNNTTFTLGRQRHSGQRDRAGRGRQLLRRHRRQRHPGRGDAGRQRRRRQPAPPGYARSTVDVSVTGGLTLKGATLPLGNVSGSTRSRLFFPGVTPQSIVGVAGFPGTLLLGAHTGNGIDAVGAALTLGPNLTVTGAGGLINSGAVAFHNQGTIMADPQAVGLTTGIITLSGAGWTNDAAIGAQPAGVIGARNGGTLNLGGTFTNNGTINNNLSTVNLVGTLNNVGKTLLLNASTGSMNLVNGGTLSGGTLAAADGTALVVTTGGTLAGVTLDGSGVGADPSPLDITPFTVDVFVTGGLTLKGATLPLGSVSGSTRSRLFFPGVTPQSIVGVAGFPGTILLGAHPGNGIDLVARA